MNTQSSDPSYGVQDLDEVFDTAAAVDRAYCEMVARKILAALPADAVAQLLAAKRAGTLDELLTEAVRRASVQAAAVREFTSQVRELVEPVTSALIPRPRLCSDRGTRDVV